MRSTARLGLGPLLAPLLALPLFACGNVAPIPGIAPDDAPRQLALAICPKAYECCVAAQLMDNGQAGTDVATCETMTEAAFTKQVDGIKAAEQKGRVAYDGLKVQACVDHLHAATTTCTELNMTNHFSGIAACSTFLEPKVPVGGACDSDLECVGGFCDKTAVPSGETGDGVCRALARDGEACSASAPCVKDLTCDPSTLRCKAPVAGGAAGTANACFYTSACNFSGGDRGAASLLTVGLLLVAIARRRRAGPNA